MSCPTEGAREAREKAFRPLHEAGLTDEQIAVKLSLSGAIAVNIRVGMGLKSNRVRSPITPGRRAKIVELLSTGKQSGDVAKALNESYATVVRIRAYFSGEPVSSQPTEGRFAGLRRCLKCREYFESPDTRKIQRCTPCKSSTQLYEAYFEEPVSMAIRVGG